MAHREQRPRIRQLGKWHNGAPPPAPPTDSSSLPFDERTQSLIARSQSIRSSRDMLRRHNQLYPTQIRRNLPNHVLYCESMHRMPASEPNFIGLEEEEENERRLMLDSSADSFAVQGERLVRLPGSAVGAPTISRPRSAFVYSSPYDSEVAHDISNINTTYPRQREHTPIMFSDLDGGSVMTGMSQQELIRKKVKDSKRRKERKISRKKKRAVISLPSALLGGAQLRLSPPRTQFYRQTFGASDSLERYGGQKTIKLESSSELELSTAETTDSGESPHSPIRARDLSYQMAAEQQHYLWEAQQRNRSTKVEARPFEYPFPLLSSHATGGIHQVRQELAPKKTDRGMKSRPQSEGKETEFDMSGESRQRGVRFVETVDSETPWDELEDKGKNERSPSSVLGFQRIQPEDKPKPILRRSKFNYAPGSWLHDERERLTLTEACYDGEHLALVERGAPQHYHSSSQRYEQRFQAPSDEFRISGGPRRRSTSGRLFKAVNDSLELSRSQESSRLDSSRSLNLSTDARASRHEQPVPGMKRVGSLIRSQKTEALKANTSLELSPPRNHTSFVDQEGAELSPIRPNRVVAKSLPRPAGRPLQRNLKETMNSLRAFRGSRVADLVALEEAYPDPPIEINVDDDSTLFSAYAFIETVAAIVIQTAIRRFLAMRFVDGVKESRAEAQWFEKSASDAEVRLVGDLVGAQVVDSFDQGFEQVALNLYELAAIQIQAVFRGFWVRDCLDVDHYCATLIQKTVRGYFCREEYQRELKRIILVQSWWRRNIARDHAANILGQAILIQAAFRGYRVRQLLRQYRASKASQRAKHSGSRRSGPVRSVSAQESQDNGMHDQRREDPEASQLVKHDHSVRLGPEREQKVSSRGKEDSGIRGQRKEDPEASQLVRHNHSVPSGPERRPSARGKQDREIIDQRKDDPEAFQLAKHNRSVPSGTERRPSARGKQDRGIRSQRNEAPKASQRVKHNRSVLSGHERTASAQRSLDNGIRVQRKEDPPASQLAKHKSSVRSGSVGKISEQKNRGNEIREQSKEDSAATLIQAKWRSFVCETLFTYTLVDVLIIQEFVRRWLAKKRLAASCKAPDAKLSPPVDIEDRKDKATPKKRSSMNTVGSRAKKDLQSLTTADKGSVMLDAPISSSNTVGFLPKRDPQSPVTGVVRNEKLRISKVSKASPFIEPEPIKMAVHGCPASPKTGPFIIELEPRKPAVQGDSHKHHSHSTEKVPRHIRSDASAEKNPRSKVAGSDICSERTSQLSPWRKGVHPNYSTEKTASLGEDLSKIGEHVARDPVVMDPAGRVCGKETGIASTNDGETEEGQQVSKAVCYPVGFEPRKITKDNKAPKETRTPAGVFEKETESVNTDVAALKQDAREAPSAAEATETRSTGKPNLPVTNGTKSVFSMWKEKERNALLARKR